MNKRTFFHISLLMSGLAILPGCMEKDEAKKEKKETAVSQKTGKIPAGDTSAVIATIGPDEKPLLTANMLEKEIANLIEQNPQIEAMMTMQPGVEKEIAKGIVQQDVISEYVRRNKLDQTPEYQEILQKGMKQAYQAADGKAFLEHHPATVSDKEVKAFYEEEKGKNPQFIVSRGGSKAMGVPFESEEKAKAFLAKAKAKPTQFEGVAKQAELKDEFKDFNLVHTDSFGIDPVVKEEVLKVSKFPSVQMVKGDDDKYWVVAVTAKEEPKYHDFEQIKDQLKQYLSQQKQVEAMKKALDQYMKDFQVEIKDEFFKERLKEKQQAQAAQQEQYKQAMMAQNGQNNAQDAEEESATALDPAQTL